MTQQEQQVEPSVPDPTRTPMLQKLSEQHHAMVDAVLVGMDAGQIAAGTGRSIVGVRNILASPLFGQELARRREEQRRRQDETSINIKVKALGVLENSAVKAAEKQVALLDSVDERVVQTAVTNIFDRLWPKDNSKNAGGDNVGVKVVLGPEAIINLQQVLRELKDEPAEPTLELASTSNV